MLICLSQVEPLPERHEDHVEVGKDAPGHERQTGDPGVDVPESGETYASHQGVMHDVHRTSMDSTRGGGAPFVTGVLDNAAGGRGSSMRRSRCVSSKRST